MPEFLTQILFQIPVGFWGVLSEMAPYLLFGFFMAGVLSVLVSPQVIERHLSGGVIWPVIKAAGFGVPLPLCSCGVIPVSASLRRHGASKGATVAFLISTPQDGVDSIMVTFSLLGGVFAVFRPLAALISGVIGGVVVSLIERTRKSQPPSHSENDPRDGREPGVRGKIRHAFSYGFRTLPQDIGRALLIGLVIAALISSIVPKNYFASIVPPGIAQMLVLMAAGIPVYVCATASIPLAYALILAGVSPGAAFAFLMTGPATNAATITTVWKVMGKRTTIIYLATMVLAALGGGLLLDRIVTGDQVAGAHAARWMLPPLVKHVSAVALLGVLITAVLRPLRARLAGKRKKIRQATELRITGMTCTHCENAVRRALLSSPGVAAAEVDLQGGRASVQGDYPDPTLLCEAVRELGYGAELAAEENDRPEQCLGG